MLRITTEKATEVEWKPEDNPCLHIALGNVAELHEGGNGSRGEARGQPRGTRRGEATNGNSLRCGGKARRGRSGASQTTMVGTKRWGQAEQANDMEIEEMHARRMNAQCETKVERNLGK